jgi:hypothetical protein
MTPSAPAGGAVACGDCGMPCEPNEYHPFAACLMFTACHSSTTVRENLNAVRGVPLAAVEALVSKWTELAELAERESERMAYLPSISRELARDASQWRMTIGGLQALTRGDK